MGTVLRDNNYEKLGLPMIRLRREGRGYNFTRARGGGKNSRRKAYIHLWPRSHRVGWMVDSEEGEGHGTVYPGGEEQAASRGRGPNLRGYRGSRRAERS